MSQSNIYNTANKQITQMIDVECEAHGSKNFPTQQLRKLKTGKSKGQKSCTEMIREQLKM